MNYRKILFSGAILIGVVSSFAFTAKKKLSTGPAYYQDHFICTSTYVYDDNEICDPNNTGAVCTFNGSTITGGPAGATIFDDAGNGFTCAVPWRSIFSN